MKSKSINNNKKLLTSSSTLKVTIK